MASPVLSPPTTPAAGMVVFLRPEDVAQDVGEGYYGLVTHVHDATALVEPLGGSSTVMTEAALHRHRQHVCIDKCPVPQWHLSRIRQSSSSCSSPALASAVMHLCRVTLVQRMDLQFRITTNMNDISNDAKVPDAPRPKSWPELQDAVNNLVAYCNEYTDQDTARVAHTLAAFVSTMQAYGRWPEPHLDVLSFWINERLGEYRDLVDSQARYGVGRRTDAMSWFSTTSPLLAPFHALILQRDVLAYKSTANQLVGHSGIRASPAAATIRRGIPPEVATAIPRRNGHDLCLMFASRRGCRVTGDTCTKGDKTRGHFVVPNLPRRVRELLGERFGGVSANYQ